MHVAASITRSEYSYTGLISWLLSYISWSTKSRYLDKELNNVKEEGQDREGDVEFHSSLNRGYHLREDESHVLGGFSPEFLELERFLIITYHSSEFLYQVVRLWQLSVNKVTLYRSWHMNHMQEYEGHLRGKDKE